MRSAGLFLLLTTFIQVVPAQTPEEPLDPVNRFHTGLIEMMKTPNYVDRKSRLRPIVQETFDTATVARIALGRNWRNFPETDRATLSNLMTEVIVSSYASRFPEYEEQQFEVIGEKPMKSNRTIVRTRMLTTTETVELDYQLVSLDGRWKIFDVIANGVSDLSLKRATYSSTFKSSGFNGVIEEIKQTIQNNEAKANADP
jgi:phospholipid transport system substrate-binding protein